MILVAIKTPLVFFSLSAYFLVMWFSLRLDSLESVWVMMEVTTFIFVGIALLLSQRSSAGMRLISYFLTQSVFSLVLLMAGISSHFRTNFMMSSLIIIVIFFKLGVFPIHSWYFTSVLYLPNPSFILALTFQKILPIYILRSYTRGFSSELLALCSLILLLSLVMASSLSLSTPDLRSVIVLTSIANNIWLFSSLLVRFRVFIVFIAVYFSFLSLLFSTSNAVKCASLVTLSGLPPFPIFFIKLFIVYGLVSFRLFAGAHLYCIILMLGTLLVSLSYIRLVINYTLSLSF